MGAGRPKGGEKIGGRQKGTPNKITVKTREIIFKITSDYYNSEEFSKDLKELESKDRLWIMEKLLNYSVPKLQSTTVELTSETEKTIEEQLKELAKNNEL
jgi:hypothetical protein